MFAWVECKDSGDILKVWQVAGFRPFFAHLRASKPGPTDSGALPSAGRNDVMIEAVIKDTVCDFVTGKMDMSTFKSLYDSEPGITDWLQGIVDNIRDNDLPIKTRTVTMKGVANNKPYQQRSAVEGFIKKYLVNEKYVHPSIRENPPQVIGRLKSYNTKTAFGASGFFHIIADIYYQIDQETIRIKCYEDHYVFTLQTIPEYLCGGAAEDYITSVIVPQFSETMAKTTRRKAIRAAIKEAFVCAGKSYPRWIQSSEWPIGTDSIPMMYIRQKGYEHYTEYYFEDRTTHETSIVRQCW